MGLIAAGVAGAALGAAGTWAAGNSADARKRHLTDIANTPGVNINDVYGDALGGMEQNQGRAEGIASRTNKFANQQLIDSLNQSIPGYSALQAKRSAIASDLLNGSIPADVAQQIQRNTAARALSGGYGGSQAASNLTARDLGLTSLDLINRGQQYTSGILSSTPLARLQNSSDLLNIGAGDVLNTRSAERAKRLDMLTGVSQMPGKGDIWAQYLQNTGSNLSGIASAGGGGAGGGGGGASAAGILGAFCWVAREVYGPTNHRWVMFRSWLNHDAPNWLYRLYATFGYRYSRFISDKPMLKAATRWLMDQAI